DQIVLRMDMDPTSAFPRVVRLREAVFTVYRRGVWTRSADQSNRLTFPPERAERPVRDTRAQQLRVGRLSVDLNMTANGYLFLPYGAEQIEVEREYPTTLRDGVVQLPGGARSVRYTAAVRGVEPRGVGKSV